MTEVDLSGLGPSRVKCAAEAIAQLWPQAGAALGLDSGFVQSVSRNDPSPGTPMKIHFRELAWTQPRSSLKERRLTSVCQSSYSVETSFPV